MNNVLNVVRAMEKSTCREIAARMKKDIRDMFKILDDMKDKGLVKFVNGYWSATDIQPSYETHKSTPLAPANTVVKVKAKKQSGLREKVIALLKDSGCALDTSEITEKLELKTNALNGTLGKLAAEGLIVKCAVGKLVTWTLPNEADKKESPATNTLPAKTTSEIVADIPAFTRRDSDLIVPTAAGITNEIRRTKAKLASLKRLRVITRALRRQSKLLQELAQ